jgi:hypothetical protein
LAPALTSPKIFIQKKQPQTGAVWPPVRRRTTTTGPEDGYCFLLSRLFGGYFLASLKLKSSTAETRISAPKIVVNYSPNYLELHFQLYIATAFYYFRFQEI